MPTPPKLTQPQIKHLKAKAQHLDPILKIGKNGPGLNFQHTVDETLTQHELIKIKFLTHKDQKKEIAATVAANTSAHLITIIGHTAILYRPHPTSPKIHLPSSD